MDGEERVVRVERHIQIKREAPENGVWESLLVP